MDGHRSSTMLARLENTGVSDVAPAQVDPRVIAINDVANAVAHEHPSSAHWQHADSPWHFCSSYILLLDPTIKPLIGQRLPRGASYINCDEGREQMLDERGRDVSVNVCKDSWDSHLPLAWRRRTMMQPWNQQPSHTVGPVCLTTTRFPHRAKEGNKR